MRDLVDAGHDVLAVDLVDVGFPAGVDYRRADLLTSQDLPTILKGAEVVFHLAARLSTAPPKQIRITNTEGTRRIMEAALKAGARGLIYTSSIAVYGDTGGEWVDESAPLMPHTHYGKSKVSAENTLRSSGPGLSVTILRPGFVYGPNCPLLDGFVSGRPLVAGSGDNFGCYLHVADLVAALKLSADNLSGLQVYNVADDEPLPSRQFIELVAAAAGKGPPGHVPVLPLRIALPVIELLSSYQGGFRLTTDFLKIALTSIRVRTGRIRETLGWHPRFPSSRNGLKGCFAKSPASGPRLSL